MNTSLLIATCDSYSFLWENLATLNEKYIGLKDRVISCEKLSFPFSDYKSVNSPDKPWGQRIIEALNEVKTDFVFFILDDYYFINKFDRQYFESIEKLLTETQYNKYCFDCTNYSNYRLFPFRDNLFIQHQSSEYLTTLQPSVWRVEYLRKILQPNYSPWDFELLGTAHNNNYNNKIFMEIFPRKFYFNATRKGRVISEGWDEVKKIENLKDFVL